MTANHEITVAPNKTIPQGYAFLPKGIPYKTLHCRRLTHEAGKPLYIVKDPKSKKVLGIRVPKSIFFHVQSLAKETLSARRAVTEVRDATLVRQAATELDNQFPDLPESEKEMILKHAFRKYSRRVGRTGQIPLSEKVQLAVRAHIRHKHTNYDRLMNCKMDKKEARKKVAKTMHEKLCEWGATGDLQKLDTKKSAKSPHPSKTVSKKTPASLSKKSRTPAIIVHPFKSSHHVVPDPIELSSASDWDDVESDSPSDWDSAESDSDSEWDGDQSGPDLPSLLNTRARRTNGRGATLDDAIELSD